MSLKVPQYEHDRIQRRGLPGVRVDASGAGQGLNTLGRGMVSAGRDVSAFAQRMQAEEDGAAVLEATNQFRAWDTEYRNNPETGVFSKQNKDALGLYKASGQAYDKAISDIEGTLTNDTQKKAFRKWVSGARAASLDSISRHEARQRKAWQVNTAKQALTSEAEGLIANYADQAQMAEAFDRLDVTLRAMTPGMGEDFYSKQMDSYKSKVHVAKVEAMLNDEQTDMAKAYLKEYGDEIDGSVRDDVRKAVRDAGLASFVQQESESLFAKYGIDGEAQAIKWIRDHYDGDKETKLIAQTEARYVDERRFKAQREQKAFDSVYAGIERTGSYASALKLIDGSGLKAQHRASLRAYASTYYKAEKEKLPETTHEAATKIQGMLDEETLFEEYPTWDEFFAEFGGELSFSDRNKYHKMYPSLGVDEDPAVVYSLQKAINAVIKSAGFESPGDQSRITDSVLSNIAHEEKRLGRKLSVTERTDIIEGIVEKERLVKKGMFNDVTLYKYQIPPGAKKVTLSDGVSEIFIVPDSSSPTGWSEWIPPEE